MTPIHTQDLPLIQGGFASSGNLFGAVINAAIGAGSYAYHQHTKGTPISFLGMLGNAVVSALTTLVTPSAITAIWRANGLNKTTPSYHL